jgi:hypothetical protein
VKIQRQTIAIAIGALALYAGGSAIGSCGSEISVLRTFDANGLDTYTTVWAIDENPHVWIRAHRADREWLEDLVRYPRVELKRHGRSQGYRAAVFDRPDASQYVNKRFRDAYGWADRWRELREGNHPIPVRLDPI